MATTTSNLGLTKPDYTDEADVDVLNDNFDVLDREVVKRTNVVNLLDNSDFRIAQAGYDGYHGTNKYACDRWRFDGETTKVDKGIMITGDYGLHQVVQIPAGTYTLAFGLSNGVVLRRAIFYNNGAVTEMDTSGTATTGAYINEYAAGSNGELLIVQIVVQGGMTHTVEWAALYPGAYTADTLPEYQPKGYATELMECQRYYHLYATEAARPAHGLDCAPPMRLDAPTQGTISINGVTYYYNGADL